MLIKNRVSAFNKTLETHTHIYVCMYASSVLLKGAEIEICIRYCQIC